jgi:hypothetical protein
MGCDDRSEFDVDCERLSTAKAKIMPRPGGKNSLASLALTSREPATAPIFQRYRFIFYLVALCPVVKPRILSSHTFLRSKGRKHDSNYTQASKPLVARSQQPPPSPNRRPTSSHLATASCTSPMAYKRISSERQNQEVYASIPTCGART